MKQSLKVKQLFPLLVVAFAMVVIFPWSGMMEAQKTSDAKEGLEVTIHVFSGRPNPVFVISDEEKLKEFEELVNKSKVHEGFDKSTVIPSILGYNGIVVKPVGEVTVLSDLEMLAVYHGTIEKKTKSVDGKDEVVTTFLVDEGGAVEDFLLTLALAEGAIDQKIYDFIKK
jgi:hypothetical protein